MRALAGPAMLLVLVGGIGLYRCTSAPDSPSRDFLDLEFAGADEDETGSCYALSTVIVANTALSGAVLQWKATGETAWTLSLDQLQHDSRGPVHLFLRLTFDQRGEQAHLTAVEASEGQSTELKDNIDGLLQAPNARRSTPVERCKEPGATGYNYRGNKTGAPL